RRMDLAANVFLAAEGTSSRHVHDADLLIHKREARGYLLAVLEGYLGANVDHDTVVHGIRFGQGCLGLQEGMFAEGSAIGAFYDEIGLLEAGFDISLRELYMHEHVALIVHPLGAGLE